MAPTFSAAAAALLLGTAPRAAAFKPPHGPSQAFVQLFEWSWDDVAVECEEWLGPKGFTAVQISPPNEHASGSEWVMRYQPVSYKLVSRSGNESQFISMVERCRKAGVGIYADAVFNHMAAYSGVGVAGGRYGYRHYPSYTPDDFHHSPGDTGTNCGISNYNDQYNVWYCDLEGLPDLCTECESVQKEVAKYIDRMADIGIAGIRIDAAKNMNTNDISRLLARVNTSLFKFQEVPYGGVIQEWMYYHNGPVAAFGYGPSLAGKFLYEGQLYDDLPRIGESWGLPPEKSAVVFLDNHDTQRGSAQMTYKSGAPYILATVFMLAHPYGYPRVMSSYFFDSSSQDPPSTRVHGPDGTLHCGPGQPWACEHRHPAIANMVAWRRSAGGSPISKALFRGSTAFFCRGDKACVALNRMNQPWSATLEVPLKEGLYCDVIQSDSGDCPSIRVAANGTARVTVPPLGAAALHIGAPKKLV
mmetsp:Transcript_34238/g.102275  ORF Transcript_34238/g.102275 Transcript_34238/m.102275 type:complete len:472 (+) Transcript_34238:65-1480(+)